MRRLSTAADTPHTSLTTSGGADLMAHGTKWPRTPCPQARAPRGPIGAEPFPYGSVRLVGTTAS